MEMRQLRKIIADFPKFPGTKVIKPASVCNEGFPGNFNLSYSEAEQVERFGQYLDYNKDLIYSKIQPVIRFQDWLHIVNSNEHSYRYLSVFDLADIGGTVILKDSINLEKVVSFSINSLANFLFEKLSLDKNKLRISYFAGGNVREATNGKYDFDFNLLPDEMIRQWKSNGIADNQFIPEKTRDTLLALNLYGLPTPWGFRHEINYLHNGKLLDIGTFEYFFYRPIFENGKIVNLRRWEHLFVISAVGLERLLMVINNFERVTDCLHIKPLTETILEVAANKNYSQAEILCQALRAIHRIISDCGAYEKLSPRRKEKLRSFYKAAIKCHEILGIELKSSQLENFLKFNADLQDFYPELKASINKTAKAVLEADARFKTDRSKLGV